MRVGDSARGEELLVNATSQRSDMLPYTEILQTHVPYLCDQLHIAHIGYR